MSPRKASIVCALLLQVYAASAASKAFAAPKQADVSRLLLAVQKTYQNKSITAAFSQTYTDAITGPRPTETGTLSASGDGRVRFDYDAPQRKMFLYDGNTAYFYEPDAAQVTLIDGFKDQPAAQTMAFLWGQGALTTAFAPGPCQQSEPQGDKNRCVSLTPLTDLPGVQRVDLYIDNAKKEIAESLLVDKLGNVTRYTLTRRKLGPIVKDGPFSFVVPQGISVLHTGG